jgi:hypothetical protein
MRGVKGWGVSMHDSCISTPTHNIERSGEKLGKDRQHCHSFTTLFFTQCLYHMHAPIKLHTLILASQGHNCCSQSRGKHNSPTHESRQDMELHTLVLKPLNYYEGFVIGLEIYFGKSQALQGIKSSHPQ